MSKTRILIVDDDPDILDVLNITLSQEDYEVLQAKDGEEALNIIQNKSPNLVILDYRIPKLNGQEVCRRVKKDILLSHLPIIMLTGSGDVIDKVGGLDAGADDYMVKPFEPQELLARIRTILRRSERDLDANPLTRLPGNVSILNKIEECVEKNAPFAVCYLDLDKFKSYNDKYGFEHGDEAIKETARILIRAVKEAGSPDDFIGHIGGDDFVIVTAPDVVDKICEKIIRDFEGLAPALYNEQDRKAGFITGKDRQGKEIKIPLLSISIGVVTNTGRKITHVAQIGEIGAELKSYAKLLERSNYIKDRRAD